MNPVFRHVDTPLESGITVIAASAGTGKTFTLAALVVRLVAQHGVPIHKLLLTTYTVAATAELRERIRARLIDTLQAVESGTPPTDEFLAALLPLLPPEAPEYLRVAVRDFDEASIHTIHGFCQRALREQAFETGVSFDPEVVADTAALFAEVTEDYWRRHLYAAPALESVCLSSTGLTPESLKPPLRRTAGRSQLHVLPAAEELSAAQQSLNALLTELRTHWPAWEAPLRRLLVEANDWGNKGYKSADLEPLHAALAEMAASDADCAALQRGIAALAHLTEENVQAATSKRRKGPPVEHPLFDLATRFEAARRSLHECTIAHFLAWSRGALDRRKGELGILLFDDLLTRLHSALDGPGGAAAIRQLGGRFDAVLVDEFQDTDPVQAEIFLRLFGTENHRLFLIGDPKQAIYGFRGADLFAYLKAIHATSRHYTLRQNQRSSKAMVSAVNTLFQRPSAPFLDDRIPFEPVDAAGRTDRKPLLVDGQSRPPVHWWYWDSPDRVPSSSARTGLPAMMAAEICRLLSLDATIDGKPLRPGDCAILCRDNRQARELADALADQGVPAVVMSDANVFASTEAAELRMILASLAEPAREPLIRSALTTAPLGFTMQDLVAIEADPAPWEAVRQRWLGHHTRWRENGFIRMFREFLRLEGIRHRLLAQPSGERALTNLQHLAELLHAAAESQHLGPAALIHWYDQQIAAGLAATETELRLDRDDSAVRVITIHKSKGLEYPIVFCPFLWAGAGLRENADLLFHDDQGDLVLDLRRPRDPAHEARAENESLAEELRLLYVALTRAKYECHIVWGPFAGGRSKEPEASALLRLLEPPKGEPTFATLTNHAALLTPTGMRDTLRDLAAENPNLFAIHALPVEKAPRFGNVEGPPPAISVREFNGYVDSTWRAASYSGLTTGHEHDFDEDSPERRLIDPATLTGIHAFPRGIKPGTCVHDILQHLDFQGEAEETTELITRKLRQHAMYSEASVAALITMVDDIRTLLPANASHRGTMLRELEFHLPAGMLTPSQLGEFAGSGLSFEPQRGVLKGFIDLVFEHQGQYFILDWKTNWLGTDSAAYTEEAMNTEMRRLCYDLQRHLYLLALHRFLRLRLRDYDPAQHLGGAYYVFLRGLDREHPGRGILQTAPDFAALKKLERLFPCP